MKNRNKIPTVEVKKWPKKIFLGCAKGLSGYPYNSTIDEPKDAVKKRPYCVLYVNKVKAAIVIVENKPAKNPLIKFSFFIL